MRRLEEANLPAAAPKAGDYLVDVCIARLALPGRLKAEVVELLAHELGLCHGAE
jgi:hypothetical protein